MPPTVSPRASPNSVANAPSVEITGETSPTGPSVIDLKAAASAPTIARP